jgi:hypothetical protein
MELIVFLSAVLFSTLYFAGLVSAKTLNHTYTVLIATGVGLFLVAALFAYPLLAYSGFLLAFASSTQYGATIVGDRLTQPMGVI